MSDVAVTATAPVAPVTAVTTAPTPPAFTSQPIDTKTTETAVGKAEPEKVEPKQDNVIAALAKASNEARLTKKQIAERDATIESLKAELDAAKAGSAKALEVQAELDAVLKNPGILLKKGKTFQEILDALVEPDAVADPKLTELEQRLAAREKADAEAKEAADKAELERTEAARNAENDAARKYVASLVASEGFKPAQDGTARWALVSMDDSAVERARVEVLKYITENKVEETKENVDALLVQAFDQMEQAARDEVTKRYERLKPVTNGSPDPRNTEPHSFAAHSQDKSETVQPRPVPGITAAIRGNPLPPPSGPKAPSFTNGLR